MRCSALHDFFNNPEPRKMRSSALLDSKSCLNVGFFVLEALLLLVIWSCRGVLLTLYLYQRMYLINVIFSKFFFHNGTKGRSCQRVFREF